MKPILVCLAVITFFSANAHADFKTFRVKSNSELSLPSGCLGSNNSIQLKNERISIVKNSGETYSLGLDDQQNDLAVIFGSSDDSDICVLAIKYAENDVNESFTLFVYDEGSDKYKVSAVPSITNPDFLAGKISSQYNDGPVSHNDMLCFSRKVKDYYTCEKREQFSEKLERKQVCGEITCSEPQIVKENTSSMVTAVVVISKAYLFNKGDDSRFSQRKAYLVKKDVVMLSDFFQSEDGLYYRITYSGKNKTEGWVSAAALSVEY
ncbi:hypothetical protein [Pseudomonas syringae]|uniref:hypothetical protein n=2 Tax=Pseudomonas syringae group TaxID=136849 RepID=UPI000466685C|nr:hypothetical protein [Pseudomonas syringae]